MTGEKVFPLDELDPGSAKRVVLGGLPIAVVRDSAGEVHALGDTCTHGEISLSEGFVEDDSIECWAHGSAFGLADGQPGAFRVAQMRDTGPVRVEQPDATPPAALGVAAGHAARRPAGPARRSTAGLARPTGPHFAMLMILD